MTDSNTDWWAHDVDTQGRTDEELLALARWEEATYHDQREEYLPTVEKSVVMIAEGDAGDRRVTIFDQTDADTRITSDTTRPVGE